MDCPNLHFYIGVLKYLIQKVDMIEQINLQITNNKAEWLESNNQPYLYVEASTDYELGYLTGQNIANQITSLKLLLQFVAPQYNTDYDSLLLIARDYLEFIPWYQQQEFQGLADGASNVLETPIAFQDILLQNCWLDIFYGQISPLQFNFAACTALDIEIKRWKRYHSSEFRFYSRFRYMLEFYLS